MYGVCLLLLLLLLLLLSFLPLLSPLLFLLAFFLVLMSLIDVMIVMEMVMLGPGVPVSPLMLLHCFRPIRPNTPPSEHRKQTRLTSQCAAHFKRKTVA